ncbi:MAG TPA: right-handed parallel beta-helix repeat-containing protein [Actinomycetota bacterium]|nr:right-handed parallel beta-helix repeat-containing protein [Actinomycetota bacterium]
MKRIIVLALVLGVASVPGAYAGGGFGTGPCTLQAGDVLPGSSGNVLLVPEEFQTIQGAVDAAAEGDTILVGPGTYHESVQVRTPGLRIRGTDRNQVVLDGQYSLRIGIEVARADRVLIENMTARGYTNHGFYWFDLTGYWGRYLTAHNNGLYGIFAFDARCGELSDSYGWGHRDAGFYIGQCYPCDAVIHNIVSESNALGYSGTNAGGNLTLRDSLWINNGLGIVPNSLDSEARPPQRGATIARNRVLENNNRTAPGTGTAGTYWGGGIVIAGGQSNSVYGNEVTNHAFGGIVIAPLPDDNFWIPSGNTIWGNKVTHNAAQYPEAYDLAQGAVSGPNNCWADNEFSTSAPGAIQTIYDCGAMATPPGGSPLIEHALIAGQAGMNGRVQSPWQTYPGPTTLYPSQPDDNGNGDYSDDLGPDSWLPALGL